MVKIVFLISSSFKNWEQMRKHAKAANVPLLGQKTEPWRTRFRPPGSTKLAQINVFQEVEQIGKNSNRTNENRPNHAHAIVGISDRDNFNWRWGGRLLA